MALRLKSLELHGYKTFAAKIDFEFAEGITAIVGPNGSGKSNIADALRWVLGEQSFSLLRAKKTEDMIFAGSEQRPRSGMASATITFDNSDAWLPVDFSEVGLSRRAYRDGRNEYLLNSQHVRLKDINELLAQSGLSERTYTILGQGLVDASLALKADERRRLFEEAAGIGLYRSRREEALRRIETTKRNLDRALDILAELEPRLRSLERQAARAQEYAQVQADLRILLREWYGYHWHRAQQDLTTTVDRLRVQEAKLNEERDAYQRVRQEFATYRDQLNGIRARLNSWHRHSAQLHANRESSSSQAAMLDERQRFLLDDRQSILSEQIRMEDEERAAAERLQETNLEIANLIEETNSARVQMEAALAALNNSQSGINRLERELEDIRKRIGTLSTQRAGLEARMKELTERSGLQQEKSVNADQTILRLETERSKAEEEYQRSVKLQEEAEEELQKASQDRDTCKNKVRTLDELLKQKQNALANFQTEAAGLQAQVNVLEQAEQSLAGYADGSKYLLEAARRQELNGAMGALSNSIEIEAELEAAIAAALGEYTDAILLQRGQDAEQAISLLDGVQSSRASLLPLDWLQPSEGLSIKKSGDVLGIAAELVKSPAELRPVVDLLLGQVIVVRDWKAARAVLTGKPGSVRAVTLKGEVFYANGPVLAGVPTKAAALGRPRQRREFKESITKIERKISDLENEITKIIENIAAEQGKLRDQESRVIEKSGAYNTSLQKGQEARIQAEAAQQQIDWQKTFQTSLETEILQTVKDKETTSAALLELSSNLISIEQAAQEKLHELAGITLDELQTQVTHWTTQVALAEKALSNGTIQQKERADSVTQLRERKTTLDKRLAELEQSLKNLEEERNDLQGKAVEFNSQLDELRKLIEPAEKGLETTEQQERELQKRETEGQVALARVERNTNQLQLEFSRKQEAIETLRGKIEDDFGLVMFEYAAEVSGPVPLPLEGLVEQLPVVTEPSLDLEETLTQKRAQLRRMGAINPEAQQEYKAVKERHVFLSGQIEDLHKAENDLHRVISELDDLTRKEFQKTFDSVAEQFHTIFHRLFGGGAARLVLTDPENLTVTGIDIEARLPGRREQGLALLSGGERSLTAIALVFALLKVSPTPVCVLDEVDAMLDEANVGRFRDLLAELSKETQFIIITHNRNTVQAADVIYGVTMGRDSTSQVISLKLDEISEDYYR